MLIEYIGFQVAPAELEGISQRYEGVADVCFVVVQDQQTLGTEVPRAYVIKAPGWRVSYEDEEGVVAADQFRRWSYGRLASHE